MFGFIWRSDLGEYNRYCLGYVGFRLLVELVKFHETIKFDLSEEKVQSYLRFSLDSEFNQNNYMPLTNKMDWRCQSPARLG